MSKTPYKYGEEWKVYLYGDVYHGNQYSYAITDGVVLDFLFARNWSGKKGRAELDILLAGGETVIREHIAREELNDVDLQKALKQTQPETKCYHRYLVIAWKQDGIRLLAETIYCHKCDTTKNI